MSSRKDVDLAPRVLTCARVIGNLLATSANLSLTNLSTTTKDIFHSRPESEINEGGDPEGEKKPARNSHTASLRSIL